MWDHQNFMVHEGTLLRHQLFKCHPADSATTALLLHSVKWNWMAALEAANQILFTLVMWQRYWCKSKAVDFTVNFAFAALYEFMPHNHFVNILGFLFSLILFLTASIYIILLRQQNRVQLLKKKISAIKWHTFLDKMCVSICKWAFLKFRKAASDPTAFSELLGLQWTRHWFGKWVESTLIAGFQNDIESNTLQTILNQKCLVRMA